MHVNILHLSVFLPDLVWCHMITIVTEYPTRTGMMIWMAIKNISQMRRKNPDGRYITDPKDPRRMIRVWTWWKRWIRNAWNGGLDNDGDGMFNEDGPVVMTVTATGVLTGNPIMFRSGAHKYPFSQPEKPGYPWFYFKSQEYYQDPSRSIIQADWYSEVLQYQGGGAEAYSAADDAVINAIGKKGQMMIAGYKLVTIWKDMYTVYGGELDWWHGAMGCFAFPMSCGTASYVLWYDLHRSVWIWQIAALLKTLSSMAENKPPGLRGSWDRRIQQEFGQTASGFPPWDGCSQKCSVLYLQFLSISEAWDNWS